MRRLIHWSDTPDGKFLKWLGAAVLIVVLIYAAESIQVNKPTESESVHSIDVDALLVMCSALSLATDKDYKATPEEEADIWIQILARRQHVSYGTARWHIRKLLRDYGGADGVANECLDRDLVIDLSDHSSAPPAGKQ